MPGDGQTVTVDTAAGRFGPVAVGADWQTLAVAIPRAAWRAGPNPNRAHLFARRASVQLRGRRGQPGPVGGHRFCPREDPQTEPPMIGHPPDRGRRRRVLPAGPRALRHGAGRHRHAGRRRRIGPALVLERADDQAATVRFVAGAVVAYGWVRASRGRSTRGQWAWATIGVALGPAAALVWREPLALRHAQRGRRPVVVQGRTAGHVAGGLHLGDRPVAAVPRRPRARGRRPDAAGAHDAARVGARLLVVVRVAGAGGVRGMPPYFVCGAAAVVDAAGRAVARRPVLAAGVLLAPLVVWNLQGRLMKAGTNASFDFDEPRWFGDVGAAQAKALHGWTSAIRRRCRPISPSPWSTAFTHRPTT